MKTKLNKIAAFALGIIVMTGVSTNYANAAPRHGAPVQQKVVVTNTKPNTGAVVAAGAIGAIAGLTVGIAASNYNTHSHTVVYTNHSHHKKHSHHMRPQSCKKPCIGHTCWGTNLKHTHRR